MPAPGEILEYRQAPAPILYRPTYAQHIMQPSLILACRKCGHQEPYSTDAMLEYVRGVGMLKRAKEVEPELLLELFRSSAASFRCAGCGASGLAASLDEDELNDRDWGAAPVCKKCAAPIPPDRLEVFPDTEFCTQCQILQERGEGDDNREFCEYCGGVMTCRQTARRGLTGYAMRCGDCGR